MSANRAVLIKDKFFKRAERLYEIWESSRLNQTKSLSIVNGGSDNAYNKASAFHVWLFGQELIDTIILFQKDQIYILGKSTQMKYLKTLVSVEFNGKVPPVSVLDRDDGGSIQKLVDLVKGGDLGTILKEKSKSAFVASWSKVLEENEINKVDVSNLLSHVLSVKDNEELRLIRKSAEATCKAWSSASQRIVQCINRGTVIKHSDLSKEFSSYFQNAENTMEKCYDPIIMSGKEYSFKLSHQSTNSKLCTQSGTIITALGAQLSSYCTNLTRTILVFPTSQLKEAYEAILETQQFVMAALKPGVKLCDVYKIGVETLKKKNPRLEEHIYKKELGFSTGIEFRETRLTISEKCEEVVKAGMVFVVTIGVDEIESNAISISDTVVVKENGENEVLTENAKSRLKSNVVNALEHSESQQEPQEKLGRGKRNITLNNRTRNNVSNEEMRREKQKELYDQLTEAAKRRILGSPNGSEAVEEKRSIVSYKSENRFPQDPKVENMLIYVDKRNDSVILPISGIPVPYHISMIKNCSTSVEGDHNYLRITFVTASEDENQPTDFIKELTFREKKDNQNLSTAYRQIKEMQKVLKDRETEKKAAEGVVKQDKLILSVNRLNPKLKDLHVRPTVIQKKFTGALEAHTNGFRFTSVRSDRIDILYNNIKHAFFQPCDNEMTILLHFQFKNPVMWGSKSYKDVQFYTEIQEVSTDLGSYRATQDRDDFKSEQKEREMRRRLNSMFSNFCEKVSKLTHGRIEFDSPFAGLGFSGVPHRESVTLKPTTSCLVNLSELPFFIVTLSEVELVHFERVDHQLKNFDMTFVFKDYSVPPQKITDIPAGSLEKIKEWLHTCDIWYSEGKVPLKWSSIMKAVNDDPVGFFEIGGWSTIGTDPNMEEDADSDESDEFLAEEEGGNSDESSSDSSDEDEEEEEDAEMTDGGDSMESADESEDDDDEDDEEEEGVGSRKRSGSNHGGPSNKRRK